MKAIEALVLLKIYTLIIPLNLGCLYTIEAMYDQIVVIVNNLLYNKPVCVK